MTKPKKCKHCKQPFKPIRFNQKYCLDDECIKVWVTLEREKAWKKTKQKKKAELMTLQDWIKIAQTHFNNYIRERDKGQPCISCQKPAKKENAGHYHNANNHWAVRFDEDNVHLQCEYCNTSLSANLINYRINLLVKIGAKRLNELDKKANDTRKFTIPEVKELIEVYKEKQKELKNK
jgi:hypothetical protein